MRKWLVAAIAIIAVAAIVVFLQIGKNDKSELIASDQYKGYEVATFAGGCFWCIEHGFEKVPGVVVAISGFSGGDEVNPSYAEVARGLTGHTETVQVYYDKTKITYQGLLASFWRMMDPTDSGGSFYDRGPQYRPIIFVHDKQQRKLAEEALEKLDKSGRYDKPLAVEITDYKSFYAAPEYHQDYSSKNPWRYTLYTNRSGRTGFVERIWGDDLKVDYAKYKPKNREKPKYARPDDEEIKKTLSPLQYSVTQHEDTEPPFKNEYWNEKRDGIYVDVVSGEPLFSSKDKFKSGTGWPSFTRPIEASQIVNKIDKRLFTTRVEVRSKIADSHLGHVFDDGPAPTGKRYCINSASLRFIPVKDMKKLGYGKYLDQFVKTGM